MERNRIRTRNDLIVIAIIFLIIGIIIGIPAGSAITIRAVVYVAKPFVEIDVNMVNDAIYKYKNHIVDCYEIP